MARRCLESLALFAMLFGSGCTICKPVVGVVAGPAVLLSHSSGLGNCGCDGRAVVCVLAGAAVVGAVAGLVTGIISDVQYVCGIADDPARNWWDPFATNTMASSR